MVQCPTCSTVVGQEPSCPGCGVSLVDARAATPLDGQAAEEWGRQRAGGRPVSGTVLAGRYRIVGPLGRGGMGEVYRADDLRLHQTVALKFLPEALLADPAALARFHREVSLARRVSHPNVCRVFDVGEVAGHPFLTMEYIDGEDLAALLRRIGRLPADKGIEIARQLCAGLAAIHDAGVLHRDLKPANVMIDGRGRARITDFGVAAFTGEVRRGSTTATGTPAYMAPEQLARGETSVRSDLFSLGLVLYEMFTGRRAFPDLDPADLARQQAATRPLSPASLVPDLDPQASALVLRCLGRDPRSRPTSVVEVAAALPGAGPLAAALAAGETPSPEMMAAATKVGSLRPGVAALCLLGVVLGLLAVLGFTSRVATLRQVPFPHSPEVLVNRARTVLASLGHGGTPVDSAWGFTVVEAVERYLQARGAAGHGPEVRQRLTGGRPSLVVFWYRQSPRLLVPTGLAVKPQDPPRTTPGEAYVELDPEGHLFRLEVRSTPGEDAQWGRVADWKALLAAAGLSIEELVSTLPLGVPPVYGDSRVAWQGAAPGGGPLLPLRVEAASYRGNPVFLEITGSWTQEAPAQQPAGFRAFMTFYNTFFLCVAVTGGLLTRRNLRLGRGDRRGARRLAWFVFLATLAGWLFGGSHVPTWAERDLSVMAVGQALAKAAALWICYIGLEPYLRRHFPERIISWSRLLGGNLRDPLVGRDLLFGCLLGLAVTLSYNLRKLAAERLTGSSGFDLPDLEVLHGLSGLAHRLSFNLYLAVLIPLAFMVFLLLLRLLLRRESLAVAALWALLALTLTMREPTSILLLGAAFSVLTAGLYMVLWTRCGLLAGVAGHLVFLYTFHVPLTADLGSWYAGVTVFSVLLVVTLALYGFFTSIGSQPLLRSGLLDD